MKKTTGPATEQPVTPDRGENKMGAVKRLAEATADAGLALLELFSNGISFVITGDSAGSGAFTWYVAPEGSEYEQSDWVFHALRHGTADNLAGAVDGLTAAVCELYPYCDFAKARKPKRLRAAT